MLPQRQEQNDPNEQIIETTAVEKSVVTEDKISESVENLESGKDTAVEDEVSLDNVPKENMSNNNNDTDSYSYEPVVRERSKSKEVKKPSPVRRLVVTGAAAGGAVMTALGISVGANAVLSGNDDTPVKGGDTTGQEAPNPTTTESTTTTSTLLSPEPGVPPVGVAIDEKGNLTTDTPSESTVQPSPTVEITEQPAVEERSLDQSGSDIESYPGEKAAEIGLKLAEDIIEIGPSVGLIPDTQFLEDGKVSSVYSHENGISVTVAGPADSEGKLVKSDSPLNGWEIGLSDSNRGVTLKYDAKTDRVIVTVSSEGAVYANFADNTDPRGAVVNEAKTDQLAVKIADDLNTRLRQSTLAANLGINSFTN